MAAPAPAPPAPHKRRRRLALLGLLVLAVAIAAGVVLLAGGDDKPPARGGEQSPADLAQALREGKVLAGPAQAPFALRFTDDWEGMDRAELGAADPRPVAGLRRKDGTGILTVSVRGPVRGGITTLRRTLPAELEQRFDDFRLVSIRPVDVAAGRALYTSFVREKSGQVQSNLVVPDGNRRSFSVDAVIRADAKGTAQQVGAMLRTFDVVDR